MSRTLEALKLKHSPLVRVLCQLRFAPIVSMPEYLPQIQDKLRLKGYPGFSVSTTQQVVIRPSGATTQHSQRWIMHDRNQASAVALTEGYIVLETSTYTTFEDFVRSLLSVTETLVSEVKELFVQRVGLRYVNLVRTGTESWQKYLRPGMHGLASTTLKSDSQTQLLQSVAETEHGTVVVRIHQNRQGQLLPPDLSDDQLKLDVTPPSPGELLTHIDMDHFCVDKFDYEAEHFTETLWSLHDVLDHLFRESIVTEYAIQQWKG